MSAERFIGELSQLLGIAPPEIDRREPEGMSGTQLAALDPETRRLWLRQSAALPDQLLAAAHELRHLWQFERRPELMAGYRPRSELGVEAYNRQPAEIDANAFAAAVMISAFGIRPLFRGLPQDIVDSIYQRAGEMAREMEE